MGAVMAVRQLVQRSAATAQGDAAPEKSSVPVAVHETLACAGASSAASTASGASSAPRRRTPRPRMAATAGAAVALRSSAREPKRRAYRRVRPAREPLEAPLQAASSAAMRACGPRACAPVARCPAPRKGCATRHTARRPAPPPRAAAAPSAPPPAAKPPLQLDAATGLPLPPPGAAGPSADVSLSLRAYLHYDSGGPRFFSPLLPADAARPPPQTLPLLLYLPGEPAFPARAASPGGHEPPFCN